MTLVSLLFILRVLNSSGGVKYHCHECMPSNNCGVEGSITINQLRQYHDKIFLLINNNQLSSVGINLSEESKYIFVQDNVQKSLHQITEGTSGGQARLKLHLSAAPK